MCSAKKEEKKLLSLMTFLNCSCYKCHQMLEKCGRRIEQKRSWLSVRQLQIYLEVLRTTTNHA
jgi:hypothetical protein